MSELSSSVALLGLVDAYIRSSPDSDLLALTKATRNGAVHGAQIRFPHALVTTMIYHKGSLSAKVKVILSATFKHAQSLAIFGFTLRLVRALLRELRALASNSTIPESSPTQNSSRFRTCGLDAFIAGCAAGYAAFGRDSSSVNTQIVLFIFSRVALAAAKIISQENIKPGTSAVFGLPLNSTIRSATWPAFAAVIWGCAMYQNEMHPRSLAGSVQTSMKYMSHDCDDFTNLRTLIWSNT